MINSGVAFGLKRVVLLFNKPFSCIRLISGNANAFAIILRWPRHKFTRYGGVGLVLGPSNVSVCLGRCFSKAIAATPAHSERDILIETLVMAKSVPDVLGTVGVHHSIMNIRHLMKALDSLFKLRKLNGSSAETITSTPEFDTLCKRLKSQIRGIHLSDTVNTLKILTLFGLNSSSELVKALLGIIKYKVNDLSLQQIAYVHFLLEKLESCEVVNALLIALPLVFELQLNTKLDRTNMNHLAYMLQYATENRASIQSVEILIESLKTLSNSGEAMDTDTATTIVMAITNNRYVKTLKVPTGVLMQRSLTTLAERIDECNFRRIDLVTSRLASKDIKLHEEFYNEDFLDRCSTYVVKKDCDVHQACCILKNLTKIGHVNLDLIKHVVKKIVADHRQLTDCKPLELIALVYGLAQVDYKPADWQIIHDLLVNHRLLTEGKIELPWMHFAIDLAAIGCFSSTLLERIFREDFLKQFLGRKFNQSDYLRILTLHQAVVALYPTYGGPSPPQDVLDEAINLFHRSTLKYFVPFEAALVRGLGGPAYLHTAMFTRSHIYVDHVIVMRQGGFPIALSPPTKPDGSKVCIEDLEVPENSQIVVVLSLNKRCFSRNTKHMHGHIRLRIRCLEALNLAVVPISLQLWSQMPEYERIPYLMQSIKLKCAESLNNSVLPEIA